MDNIGDVFRKAREEKNLTIKDVSLQTNIGSKFIKAIENNDFSVFPGEAYTIGFIRNYADFLKVDPENIIRLFYTNQIAEAETPIEELVAPTKPRLNPIPIILLIALVAGIIISIYLILNNQNKKQDNTTTPVTNTTTTTQQQETRPSITIAELPIYSIKTAGDDIFVKIKDKTIKINIKKISTDSIDVNFTSIGDTDHLANLRREFTIELNKQLKFDFDKNKEYDLSIGIESFPDPGKVKIYLRKVEDTYENQRYYDYFTYQKPDQATLTQMQQNDNAENTNQTQQSAQEQTQPQQQQTIQLPQPLPQQQQTSQSQQQNTQIAQPQNVKLNVSVTNSMERDSVIYVWVRKDTSTEIRTVRLAKNQSVKLDADSKLTLDTNNLFGLKVFVNGKELQTKNISNDGGVGKIRFWIDKNPQGKTEIKWEINR